MLQKSEVLASLKNAGLPAREDNAVAIVRFLNADAEASISHSHFCNFMLLLSLLIVCKVILSKITCSWK